MHNRVIGSLESTAYVPATIHVANQIIYMSLIFNAHDYASYIADAYDVYYACLSHG